MTLPNPHNPPQPAQEPPRWPMVNRSQERLLQVVWRLQQLRTGWCFAEQATLAHHVGVCREQVNRIVKQLSDQRWLQVRRRGTGRTLLLRVKLPPLGACQGVTFMSHPTPPNDVTRRVTLMSHNKNSNTPNGGIGRHSPDRPAPDPSKTAPLFNPPRVYLFSAWADLKRSRPALSLGEVLQDQFRQGSIGKVRVNGRLFAIAAVEPGMTSGQMTRVVSPASDGRGAITHTWNDDDLLKLEFYP